MLDVLCVAAGAASLSLSSRARVCGTTLRRENSRRAQPRHWYTCVTVMKQNEEEEEQEEEEGKG